MTKKKSFISLVLAFFLFVPVLMLTACGSDKTTMLKSDDGIKVEGEFKKGSELKTNKITLSSSAAEAILDKLESGNIVITSTSNVVIYGIFVECDGEKVQPSSKVTVSVPLTESAGGYKAFHIKSDNSVDNLEATYGDGVLTFETGSFSYFVIVPTGDVTMNIDPDNSTPDTDDGNSTPDASDETPTAETIWTNAINTWQGATNVKVFERTSSPEDSDEEGATIEIFQIKNNAYSYDTYAENLGKGSKPSWYYVKEDETYSMIACWDDVNWEKTSGAETKNQYEGALRNIYECSDLNNNKIDFSYDKFDYVSSTSTYKYKANNNITVKLNFVNGNLDNIVIERLRDDNVKYVRTITFGNAEITVPTVEESGSGSSSK